MKTTKSSSLNARKQKFTPKNITFTGQGITKKLLEKYKSKAQSNIENINKNNDHNRVA